MIDIGLDDSGVLSVVNGDLVVLGGLESYKQGLKVRFKTFSGEWFQNTTLGIIDGEAFQDKSVYLGRVRDEILEEYGTIDILSFEHEFDAKTRHMTLTFQVSTIWGIASDEVEVL